MSMSHIHHECELELHIVEQLEAAGWLVGQSADYDAARALFPEDVIGWLDDTQKSAMAKLRAMNGAGTEAVILDRLVKQLVTDGSAHLLFSDDYAFSSPSAAAAVVCGRSANGRTSWMVEGTGQSYAAWQSQALNSVTPESLAS
jgi:hypothetical protein